MNISKLFCAFTFLISTTAIVAQDLKKEENKIQEIVNLYSDPLPQKTAADVSIPVDTGISKPLSQGEILQRAIFFVKFETPRYTKTNGVTTSNKADFLATFKYKPKVLNPQADVEGSFTMHISIEAKLGKYKYTISKISHIAKNNDFSGGDLYSEVPKCGSLKLPNALWKLMQTEAVNQAMSIVGELKETMKISTSITSSKEEW